MRLPAQVLAAQAKVSMQRAWVIVLKVHPG